MFPLRKKLLCLLITVTLVSVGVLFVGVSPTFASSHATSAVSHPAVSGGGCNNSGDGKVRACISFTSVKAVLPDAYIVPGLRNCSIEIELYHNGPGIFGDITDTGRFSFDCSLHHLYGYSTQLASKGDKWYTIATLWYDGGSSKAISPTLYI